MYVIRSRDFRGIRRRKILVLFSASSGVSLERNASEIQDRKSLVLKNFRRRLQTSVAYDYSRSDKICLNLSEKKKQLGTEIETVRYKYRPGPRRLFFAAAIQPEFAGFGEIEWR